MYYYDLNAMQQTFENTVAVACIFGWIPILHVVIYLATQFTTLADGKPVDVPEDYARITLIDVLNPKKEIKLA